jgi:HSP20 family protein
MKEDQAMLKDRRDGARNAVLWRPLGDAWSPMRELSSLHRGVDRLFEEFMAPMASSSPGTLGDGFSAFNPACDVEETESHYLISFDLPGVSREDVRIELVDNQLVVSGERKEERAEGKRSRHFMERYYGSFKRTFALPSAVDPENIEADYRDGVLRIAIPKAATARPRQIRIGDGKQTSGLFGKLLGGSESSDRRAG